MKHYLSKNDAMRAEGIIHGIDDSIYDTIEEAENDFDSAADVFAYDSPDGIRVAWTV